MIRGPVICIGNARWHCRGFPQADRSPSGRKGVGGWTRRRVLQVGAIPSAFLTRHRRSGKAAAPVWSGSSQDSLTYRLDPGGFCPSLRVKSRTRRRRHRKIALMIDGTCANRLPKGSPEPFGLHRVGQGSRSCTKLTVSCGTIQGFTGTVVSARSLLNQMAVAFVEPSDLSSAPCRCPKVMPPRTLRTALVLAFQECALAGKGFAVHPAHTWFSPVTL